MVKIKFCAIILATSILLIGVAYFVVSSQIVATSKSTTIPNNSSKQIAKPEPASTETTTLKPLTSAKSPTKIPTQPKKQSKPKPSKPNPFVPTKPILHTVAFTSQAPFAQWSNRTFGDGCEEASLLMAMLWVNDTPSITAQTATNTIQSLSDFKMKNYGFYLDVSLVDLMRTIADYYQHDNARLLTNPTANELIKPLYNNKVIIVTANGKKLGNPNFKNGGPERHALLIIGYDPSAQQFITNDPGTRNGKNYHYKKETLLKALRDYPSGDREPFPTKPTTRAIVIGR